MEMTLDEFWAAIAKSDEDAKAKAVRELTGEESRVFHTSYRPRPGWMPKGCTYTPTRYLCVCFGHDAVNAVKNATADVQWPTALRDISCEGDNANGATVGQLIGRMLDELDFQTKSETHSGKVNCTDLLFAFDDFMEIASKYLTLRHNNGNEIVDAINAVAKCIDFTEEHIPYFEDVRPTAALAVTPAEFRQRVTKLLELDTAPATPKTKVCETKRNPQDEVATLVYDVYMTDRIWKNLFPGESRKRRKSIKAAGDYVRFKCPESDTEFYDRCTDARTAITNLGKTKEKIESLWRTIIDLKAKPSFRGDKSNRRRTYTKSDMMRYNEEHGGDTDDYDERMIYPTPNGW